MAGKSKTDVSARAKAKSKGLNCSNCGRPVDVALCVSANGKKKMIRKCCQK